jgi:hypothetical protein
MIERETLCHASFSLFLQPVFPSLVENPRVLGLRHRRWIYGGIDPIFFQPQEHHFGVVTSRRHC